MVTSPDQELAQRTRRGETEAFGELVKRYQTSVFNVCYRMLGERREAEDLCQDAFIRAYQRFDYYDAERPFGPWIRRVAANLCLNHLQALRSPGGAKGAGTVYLDDERDESAAPVAKTPEAIQERAERAETIREAILSLPPHYRVVIELRHYQEMSYTEIARQLEIPLSTVKSHLFRARRMLAERLRPDGDEAATP